MRRTGHRDAKIGEHSERVRAIIVRLFFGCGHARCLGLCNSVLIFGLTFTTEQRAQKQWNKLPSQVMVFLTVKMRNYAAWLQI